MNFTVYFSVICPPEERTVSQYPAVRIYPVINTDNIGQIHNRNIPAITPIFIGECYGNMLQDVLPVFLHPQNEIVNNALLAPSPFLAAAATLDTDLVKKHILAPVMERIYALLVIIFL